MLHKRDNYCVYHKYLQSLLMKPLRSDSTPSQIARPRSSFQNRLLLVAALALQTTAFAATYQLTEIDTLGGDYGIPQAINSVGQVVGYSYTPGNQQQRAFVWDSISGLRDLGTLGGSYSSPSGINAAGQIVGSAATASEQPHAFFWTATGGMRDLGTLGGATSSALAIDPNGVVAGNSSVQGSQQEHAFVWDSVNGMRDLGTLGGTYSYSRTINQNGQVIGASATENNSEHHAFAWDAVNGMQDLGTLGGTFSEPQANNDAGQVIGNACIAGNQESHAFIWDRVNLMRDLGTLGGSYSSAQAINSSGRVVGYSFTARNAEQHAFVWDAGEGMRDLQTLGGTSSYAQAVNKAGQVLGVSYTAGNEAQHAFVWDSTNGMQDIGTLGGKFVYPQAINNAGQVTGYCTLAGDQVFHAFVWDSVNGMRDLGVLGGLNSYGFMINDKGDLAGYGSTPGETGLHGFFAKEKSDQPPLANAGPDQSVNQEQLVILDASASKDSDGDVLLYSWTQLSGPPVNLWNSSSERASFTAPTVARGGETLMFELTITANAKSATDTVSVTVVNINHAPVADAGADRTVANGGAVAEGALVMLSGENSFDVDNDAISYTWTLVGDPSVVLTGPTPSFIAPAVGNGGGPEVATLEFELRVDDGYPLDAPAPGYSFENVVDRVIIEVTNFNNAPIAAAGPDLTANEKTLVSLDGTASRDPDGDSLSYTWRQVGADDVVLTGPTPSFTVPEVPIGGATVEFELTVDDGYGGTATDRVLVHVQNINDPPRTDTAEASVSVLWPPTHRLVKIEIVGVSTSRPGLTIRIASITQDEPTSGLGDGDTAVDAIINPDGTFRLRAERSDDGDGRVYRINFTASDTQGSASGVVTVTVPKRKNRPAIDSGDVFISTK